MSKSCFKCKYQCIYEPSHEWLECKCRLDGHKNDPCSGCDKFEPLTDRDISTLTDTTTEDSGDVV